MTMGRVRVLIAEDHAVVREGTREILERDPGIEVVGEAEDGPQALALAASLLPALIVLDLRLPHLSGIDVARRLRTSLPSIKILVLSAYDDDYVYAAMEAGASGYLLKTAHGAEVVAAIHSIISGGVVLQAGVAAKYLRSHQDEASRASGEGLTDREMEILRLTAAGLRNKEIAYRLKLSRRTVEGHLSHVFNKLCVSSRTEAIVLGVSRGWFVLNEQALGEPSEGIGA